MREEPIQGLSGRIIRCILFDLGNTLWSRKDITAWRQMEAIGNQRAGALLRRYVAPELLPPINDEALGKQIREALDEHILILRRWNPEIEANGAVALTRILRELGIGLADIALGTAIFEALRMRIPESRPLFNDTLPTLAALRQRGFLLGVVSNRLYGGKPFREDLQTLGLLDYFDVHHLAISADLGIRKPNPAIFLHALRALGVAPEQAAMVGDSLKADILGAQRLGIFAIWKPKPQQIEQLKAQLSGEIRPDLIIEHVSDLLDVFAEAGEQ